MGDFDGKNTDSCTVSRLLGDRSKGEAGILSSKPISGIQEPPCYPGRRNVGGVGELVCRAPTSVESPRRACCAPHPLWCPVRVSALLRLCTTALPRFTVHLGEQELCQGE